MATTLRHLDQLLHTVERGRALNVDELGRLPVRLYGPDGQPLFTEQNPAHVKGEVALTGSSIVVPVDLQAIALSDEEAVPTKRVDRKWEETVLVSDWVLSAQQTASIDVNVSDILEFTLGVQAGTRHDWAITLTWWNATSTAQFSDFVDDRIPVLEKTNRQYGISDIIRTRAPRLRFYVTNKSNDSQTYNMWLYRLRG